jgi:hypothetical protein
MVMSTILAPRAVGRETPKPGGLTAIAPAYAAIARIVWAAASPTVYK